MSNAPLSPPGGALKTVDGGNSFVAQASTVVDGSSFTPATMDHTFFAQQTAVLRPANVFMSRLGGTVPMTAASGSMWLLGAITHNQKTARTGQKATQAVLTADIFAGTLKLIGQRQPTRHIDYRASGNAVRTFAFASVLSRQYHDKPWVVIGSYGFATAVSLSSMTGPKRLPSDVLVSAAVGEIIGRLLTHHRENQ